MPHAWGSFQTSGLRLTCCPPFATHTRTTSIALGSDSAIGGTKSSFFMCNHASPDNLLGVSSLRRGGLVPGRVFHPFIEPGHHFPQSMFCRFAGEITMSFKRKLPIADNSAVTFDCLIHSFTLNGEGARVVICHSVNEQDW